VLEQSGRDAASSVGRCWFEDARNIKESLSAHSVPRLHRLKLVISSACSDLFTAEIRL
jgi:hypothetical protein